MISFLIEGDRLIQGRRFDCKCNTEFSKLIFKKMYGTPLEEASQGCDYGQMMMVK